MIEPGYFATLGIPLRVGRDIDNHDAANGRRVAIVNRAFVEKFLGGRDRLATSLSMDTQGPIG
jgi:hypothetical protein